MNSVLTKNIWAVGRNYAKHASEMKVDIPTEPFFFLKAGTSVETGSKISLPTWSEDVQHEIEIALWIDENLNYSHFSLALDLTARDAQNAAKAKGLPWTLAKSFIGACPIGPWISLNEISDLQALQFELAINNKPVQSGRASDMIFKPQQLLEYLKLHFPLAPYDVILTGTPEGIGRINKGDSLVATLQNGKHKVLTCHWDVI